MLRFDLLTTSAFFVSLPGNCRGVVHALCSTMLKTLRDGKAAVRLSLTFLQDCYQVSHADFLKFNAIWVHILWFLL